MLGQIYIPFYSSTRERLIEVLQELLEDQDVPQYPEEILDYPIAGYTLGAWLDFLRSYPEFSDEDYEHIEKIVKNELDNIAVPAITYEPYFFLEGLLREIIINPEEVTKRILDMWMRDRLILKRSVKKNDKCDKWDQIEFTKFCELMDERDKIYNEWKKG